jgi:hypothetical protein
VANFFDRFDATAPKEEEQPNFFDRFDEAQLPAQPLAATPVATR